MISESSPRFLGSSRSMNRQGNLSMSEVDRETEAAEDSLAENS